MLELLLGVVIAAGATYYVLLPILRPSRELASDADLSDEGEDPDDDMSPRAVAFRALKEIEFDRATGKLSDQDYDSLKAKYTGEALAAMRGAGARFAVRAERESPARAPCPQHGPRPEIDAQFCSECGRRLGSASGYCARCGRALETDARYCNSCGARVAA